MPAGYFVGLCSPELTFFLWSLNASRLLRWSVFPWADFLSMEPQCQPDTSLVCVPWTDFLSMEPQCQPATSLVCVPLSWLSFYGASMPAGYFVGLCSPELTFFLWSLNASRLLRWSVFPELTFFLWSLNASRLLRWSVFPWADFLSMEPQCQPATSLVCVPLSWLSFYGASMPAGYFVGLCSPELTFFLWSLNASRLLRWSVFPWADFLSMEPQCQPAASVRGLHLPELETCSSTAMWRNSSPWDRAASPHRTNNPNRSCLFAVGSPIDSIGSQNLRTFSTRHIAFWWRSGQCRQCCSDFLLQCAGDIEADHADSGIAMDCADWDRETPHIGDWWGELTTTTTSN